jgi:serine/threonine-protein kinase
VPRPSAPATIRPGPHSTFDLAPPASPLPGASLTPAFTPAWRVRGDLAVARVKALSLLGRESLRGLGLRVAALAAARPGIAAGAAAGGLALAGLLVAGLAAGGRPASDARAHLASDRPAEARTVLEKALERRPTDTELRLLLGQALHRIPGQRPAALEAYAAVLEQGPLPDEVVAELVGDLAEDRSVADRAGRLLVKIGAPALPAILAATADGPGVRRLRALTLARDLGAEERVDRVAAYGALLADAECDVRRSAAERLGEIGNPDALPPLRELAGAKREKKGFLGRVERLPACGAAEAAAAVRRIEAARLP